METDYDGMTEWFVPVEGGFEQGWTVTHDPGGDEPLEFRMEIEGAELAVDPSGGSGTLLDQGDHLWRVSGVLAWDAAGAWLPARLEDEGGLLRVVVDDSDAIYPIVVDPTYTATDTDGDGFDAVSAGGTDCDDSDSTSYPGGTEVCDSADNDCDGSIDDSVADGRTLISFESANVYRVDAVTGVRSLMYGPFTGTLPTAANGFTGDPRSGLLYATRGSPSNLYEFNTATLTSRLVRTLTHNFYGLAMDADGVLWAVDEASNDLYRIDPATGAETVVGDVGYNVNSGGMEYAPGEDALYTMTKNETSLQYQLMRLDRTTGASTLLFTFPATYTSLSSLGYDEVSGLFYVSGNAVSLRSVDIDTGVITVVNTATTVANLSFFRNPAGTSTFYADADSDGYGDEISALAACDQPSGYATSYGDCDDTRASVYPGAAERVADGTDQDCDGVDACYQDLDGDNYGTSTVVAGSSLSCDTGTGAASSTDCDDTLGTVGAASLWYADRDSDRVGGSTSTTSCTQPVGSVASTGDCDDTHALVYPSAAERVADGIDQDCDGVDACYQDLDGDNHGTSTVVAGSSLSCDTGTGAANTDDCNDADATVGVASLWYADRDGDRVGGSASIHSCTQPAGYAAVTGDCDDMLASVYPRAAEQAADGVDQDCDGVDACYQDRDGDNYGSSFIVAGSSLSCDTGTGAANATDCDDTLASINPGAAERAADGVDQDCDGVDACYHDRDGDNYGSSFIVAGSSLSCDTGTGAANAHDCDDTLASINPGAAERAADGIDQDCDSVDACYQDRDGDNYGTSIVVAGSSLSCDTGTGAPNATDCNDALALVYPRAAERTADGIDQDCDGVDDCYMDRDGDNYGTSIIVAGSSLSCDTGSGAANTDDCDDALAAVYPGATERVGDGADSDCDGAELCYTDADGDGLRPITGSAEERAVVRSDDLDCADPYEAEATTPATDLCPDFLAYPDANGDGCGDRISAPEGTDVRESSSGAKEYRFEGTTDRVTLPPGAGAARETAAVKTVTRPGKREIRVEDVALRPGSSKEIKVGTGRNAPVYSSAGLATQQWCAFDLADPPAGVAPSSCVQRGGILVTATDSPYGTLLTVKTHAGSVTRADRTAPASISQQMGAYTAQVSPTWINGQRPMLNTLSLSLSGLTHSSLTIFDDVDGDGLVDNDETDQFFTDPLTADTDGDGVNDGDEVSLGTDPLLASSVSSADADGDGLSAFEEALYGTDPDIADTDGDGVDDDEELIGGTDPLVADIAPGDLVGRDDDNDNDGLAAWEEAALGTSDSDADSDSDGISDAAELLDGTDPADGLNCAGCSNPGEPDVDADDDGTVDDADNCPDIANADQRDSDYVEGAPADGGDACDDDDDNDGVVDIHDALPRDPTESVDTDGDGVGDNGDLCPLDATDDTDGDLVCDGDDAFPADPDESADGDADGAGDNSDLCPTEDASGYDLDVDGCLDDSDGDALTDDLDGCPTEDATGWDLDGDGCLDDSDGDTITDDEDACPSGDDRVDADADGAADFCDMCPDDPLNDQDGDNLCTGVDECPNDYSDGAGSDDTDGDTVCNSEDLCAAGDDLFDGDEDGIADACDLCPADAANDADGDGVCGDADICAGNDRVDNDADGVPDACDTLCPFDPTNDADFDGVCGGSDPCPADYLDDSDNDGSCDSADVCTGEDDSRDTDGDGLVDCMDSCPLDIGNDADGDGLCESVDVCDGVADPDQADADGDGIGNLCEPDSDADGVIDDADNCDFVQNQSQSDADNDGIGDACDDDADNDRVVNGADSCPGTPAHTPVLGNGCSVGQTCSPTATWKNHGAYVSCVSQTTGTLVRQGSITTTQKSAIDSAAAQSNVGRR